MCMGDSSRVWDIPRASLPCRAPTEWKLAKKKPVSEHTNRLYSKGCEVTRARAPGVVDSAHGFEEGRRPCKEFHGPSFPSHVSVLCISSICQHHAVGTPQLSRSMGLHNDKRHVCAAAAAHMQSGQFACFKCQARKRSRPDHWSAPGWVDQLSSPFLGTKRRRTFPRNRRRADLCPCACRRRRRRAAATPGGRGGPGLHTRTEWSALCPAER